MAKNVDKHFYERADAHIDLSNAQLKKFSLGKVSASMMYATARFNAWVSAHGFDTGTEMEGERDAIIDYFVEQYRQMLEENMDEYVEHFEKYVKQGEG